MILPPRSAAQIPVRTFRQIFQWPLILDPPRGNAPEAVDTLLRHTREQLECRRGSGDVQAWKPVDDLLDHPPRRGKHDGGGYGEFVYFHDFTQSFLYPPDKESVFQLYRRTDIAGVEATVGGDAHNFEVERLTLHLFRIGVAVLTLELLWKSSSRSDQLTLAEAERIIDYLRRSYTPWWEGDVPQRVASRVKLIRTDGSEKVLEPPARKAAEASVRSRARDALVFGHWLELVRPLRLKSEDGPWRDPSDERIPCLSYLSLTRDGFTDAQCLDQVSDGDWMRLADAEQPDSRNPWPYNPEFLRHEVASVAFYDRFAPHPRARGHATRHLFGGAHYAAVGAGWFFDNVACHHFRRHYAQLALIARFQFAGLLWFSSRITAAVVRRDETIDSGQRAEAFAAFEREILKLQDAFLTFTHRFYFTGVSSQVQPAEMYARWRRTLGIEALYVDVKSELDSAAAAVRAHQGERFAKAQERLAEIAAVGVILGLLVGALGMNVF